MSDLPTPSRPVVSSPASASSERLLLGLLSVVGVVILAMVLTAIIWKAGFIASISSLVLAAGATVAYTKVAGGPPRRGLVPLISMIVLGVVACFFTMVAVDASEAYDHLGGAKAGEGRVGFIFDNIFRADVLSYHGKDAALFVVFAALGMWRTLRHLVASQHG